MFDLTSQMLTSQIAIPIIKPYHLKSQVYVYQLGQKTTFKTDKKW